MIHFGEEDDDDEDWSDEEYSEDDLNFRGELIYHVQRNVWNIIGAESRGLHWNSVHTQVDANAIHLHGRRPVVGNNFDA